MADMFKDQITEEFGTGTDAIWHNQKVRVVAVIPPKSRTIEYRVPDETKPLTRIVDVSELSPVGASSYVQVEAAEQPVPGIPIPPRDSSKPLTEAEKEAARRDIMGEDDEPDASDAYSEALEANIRQRDQDIERLELEIKRLQAENKLYAERATKAEDEAGKQAFQELEFHKGQAARWKQAADLIAKDYAALTTNAPKTITKFRVEHGLAGFQIEQVVADGWQPETMQFVAVTSEYDGAQHAELCVVFTKIIDIPEVQPQPVASIAAMLTGDFVREEVLHRDPAPQPGVTDQMPTPAVNQMPDGAERDRILYERRARIQGKNKAARGTYVIPRANAKKMRATFAKNFPTATRILEQGKDAVLDEMDAQVQAAFKSTYLQAMGVQPALTLLLPISE